MCKCRSNAAASPRHCKGFPLRRRMLATRVHPALCRPASASRASCAAMMTQPPCSRLRQVSRYVPGLHIGCASSQLPLLPQWASGGGAVYAASFTLGFVPWYLAWYCLFLPRECMFSYFNLKGDIWLSGQDSKSQQTGSQHTYMVQLLEPGRSPIART